MSYQVLARKWRPSNFSEVAGQSHVLKSLINALDNERLHHAYLFTGTRGVGKTTLARILAKCLNCESGITSKPCETCASCVEISEGRFIDLLEVDAASRTKVEDTRELLENVQYTPARGRFKVYLIDEVHMLSNHSFNALLKTLEEPPPHVKFLFATTDPQKLPITILSRCLQFNLKNLSPKLIADYLQMVLEKESIDHDNEALWQIAGAAGGSMRDALTLVDQAISFCEGSVRAQGVVEMLGIPPQQQVFELLAAMASGNVSAVIQLVASISEQSPDYTHTLDGLLSLFHRVAIAQAIPDAVDNSFGDKEKVLELANQISAEDIQLYFQVGNKGREELKYSVEVRSTFEMLLLRMMVFSPTFATANEESHQLAEKKKTESPRLEEPASSDVAGTLASDDDAELNFAELNDDQSHSEGALVSAKIEEPIPSPQDNSHLNDSDISVKTPVIEEADSSTQDLNHERWLASFNSIPASGIVGNVLANTQLLKMVNDRIFLRLDESQSAVFSEELVAKFNTVLSQWLSKQVSVEVEIGQVSVETPAQRNLRHREEKHQEMVSDFEQDDNVQELLSRFSATVAKDSITATSQSIKDQE